VSVVGSLPAPLTLDRQPAAGPGASPHVRLAARQAPGASHPGRRGGGRGDQPGGRGSAAWRARVRVLSWQAAL